MEEPRPPLQVRQAMTVGLIVLAVAAPTISTRSDTPFLALVETLAVGMVAVFGVGAIALAINWGRARPPWPHHGPSLHVRRATILGLGVGLLTEAVLSLRMADPIQIFVSNIALALWVALFFAAAILMVEQRGLAGHADRQGPRPFLDLDVGLPCSSRAPPSMWRGSVASRLATFTGLPAGSTRRSPTS